MWQKYITRRISVQVSMAWNYGFGALMKKRYGVWLQNILVFRDASGKSEYYVEAHEFKHFRVGLFHLLKSGRFLSTFHKTCQHELEVIFSRVQRSLSVQFSGYSARQLAALYEGVTEQVKHFYVRMWIVFCFGDPLSEAVAQQLRKYYLTEEEVVEKLIAFSTPLKPNDVLNERLSLLRLALLRRRISKTAFEKHLQNHAEQYRHIPVFDPDHEPYTLAYFRKELMRTRKPAQELQELQKMFAGRKREFQSSLRTLHPDPYTRQLLVFLKEAVYLRDYRDMLRQKLNVELRSLYVEIAQRLGLTVAECSALTNREIVTNLKAGKKFSKPEARRRKVYLLIQSGDHIKLWSGKTAVYKANSVIGRSVVRKTPEVTGFPGSLGRAVGRARIVFTNRDLKKVKKGDVLIATMTRQDFVSYMRRCVAVVTDEGSVTCHAAIVTRELGIPCVVGAKIATQVFKDGDRVEVDATNGIVRKV
ncbi:MAG: PEP-utilizing enzyme [Parcubacteria group bacterium]